MTESLTKLMPLLNDYIYFLQVDAYGERMPLPGVGQAALKGPRLLVVTPFDPSLAPSIKAALDGAGLSLNTEIVGNVVQVPIVKTTKVS